MNVCTTNCGIYQRRTGLFLLCLVVFTFSPQKINCFLSSGRGTIFWLSKHIKKQYMNGILVTVS